MRFKFATSGAKTMTLSLYRCAFEGGGWVATSALAAQAVWTYTVANASSFTVAPTTQNLSTGDTNRTIATTATPSSTQFSPTFTVGTTTNPHSSCQATLSFATASGTGTVQSAVTAASAGCSGIFDNVRAQIGATQSSNTTQVVVPPQVMIKTVVGEAGGQPGDIDQQSLLSVALNRFGDSAFPGGTGATWQGVLIPSQFYGASNGTTNGPTRPLNNSAKLFTGEVGDIIGGAKCYWSPTNSQWSKIQNALSPPTTSFPGGTGAPGCWSGQPRQIVYKASVGTNVSNGNQYNNAPAFVFLRLRQATDPAVVQIP